MAAGCLVSAHALAAMPVFKEVNAEGRPAIDMSRFEYAARVEYAQLDLRAVAGARVASPADLAFRLDLNLFADARFSAIQKRVAWHNNERYTWVGRVDGDPGSHVILAFYRGTVHGTVETGGRTFEIETWADGLQRVIEVDPALFPQGAEECGSVDEPEIPVTKPAGPEAAGPVIDVMIVYEQAVVSRLGMSITAYSDALVELSNENYAGSKIDQTIRVVHTRQVNSGVTGSQNSWLSSNTEMRALRDQYGADLVAAIIEEGASWCGIASGQFTTSKRSCAIGNKTFPHELGHNMGASHAYEQYNNPSGYNYGYINHAKSWRTVMSYAVCNNGGRCTRHNRFSNPLVRWTDGDPMGIAGSRDNARRLNERSLAVSQFRPTRVGPTAVQPRNFGPGGTPFSLDKVWTGGVALKLDRPGKVEVEILDLDGRSLLAVEKRLEAGNRQLTWDKGLTPGLRLVRVRADGGEAVYKMPVLK